LMDWGTGEIPIRPGLAYGLWTKSELFSLRFDRNPYDGLNPAQKLEVVAPSANRMTGWHRENFARTDASNNVSILVADALSLTIGLVYGIGFYLPLVQERTRCGQCGFSEFVP
jgi:hypothetical protein